MKLLLLSLVVRLLLVLAICSGGIAQEEDCPESPGRPFLWLSEEFLVDRAAVVLELARLVNGFESGYIGDVIAENREDYDSLYGWSDNRNDQAIVAKKDGICFAVFQATDSDNLLDQGQNINPFPVRVEGSDCTVRMGFHQAYFAPYYDEFQRRLDQCLGTCDGRGQCPLVLGGHSQGGAAAVVAAIDLRKYNPQVITFGAPRVVLFSSPCSDVEPRRHFRFVNTHPTLGYDRVAFQFNIFRERHIGYPLFLDALDNWPIGSPRFADNASREPRDEDIHERPVYEERINAIIDRNCFPVPVARWPQGHYCYYDDECASRSCGADSQCDS